MKTKEELEALKKECEEVVNKLKDLDKEELKELAGGMKILNSFIACLEEDIEEK